MYEVLSVSENRHTDKFILCSTGAQKRDFLKRKILFATQNFAFKKRNASERASNGEKKIIRLHTSQTAKSLFLCKKIKHNVKQKFLCFAMNRFLIKSCLLLTSTLFTSIACQSWEKPPQSTSAKENYQLVIRATSVLSKAALPDSDDQAIRDLQVLIFRKDGALDAYEQATGDELQIQCTPGESQIYVFANTTSLARVKNKGELEQFSLVLTDSSPQSLPMWGVKNMYVGANCQIDISLERLVCKIVLKKIVCDLPSAYQNAKLRFDKAYLTNAPEQYTIQGEIVSWANRLQYQSEGGLLLADELNPDNHTLASQDSRIFDRVYYCFPNPTAQDSHSESWSERFTRLVLEGHLIDNGKEIKCYYPIPIGPLKANHCYIVEQYKLTRIGLEHTWDNPQLLQPDLDIRVLDWYETHRITENL